MSALVIGRDLSVIEVKVYVWAVSGRISLCSSLLAYLMDLA